MTTPVSGGPALLDQPGGDVVLAEQLDEALRGSVAGVHDDHVEAAVHPLADVGDGLIEVAAVGLGGVQRQRERLVVDLVEAEGAHGPPRVPETERVEADVGDLAVRRGAQVDGSGAAAGGSGPRRAQELLTRRDEVVRATAGALGVEDQHGRAGGHQVDEQLHLVDEDRRERLHALDRDAGGHLVGELEQLRVRPAELGGAAAYVLGQQQLAARRRPQAPHRLERALVGHREGADLLHVVAPELDAQRVLLGGREDVDDAAAHRELPAPLDHVDAGVRRLGEATDDVLQRAGVAGRQLDRLDVGQARDLRLEEAADRGDDHLQRPVGRVGAGVPQPAQDREAATDGVAARAEPFVGQRLPARVVRDGVGVDEVGELLDQVLGLPRGGGDREHRATTLDQAVHHERPDGPGAGQVEGVAHGGVGQRAGERGRGDDALGDGEERRGRHGVPPTGMGAHAEGPPSGRTGGGDKSTGVGVCPTRHGGSRQTPPDVS